MKRNLLKALGISFLIFVVLSWIIPIGTYEGGKFTTDGIDAVGLLDLVEVPVQTLLTFALYAVVFAVIGGLYGVMSKTGALDAWTEKIVKKFSGKEKRFIVFTIIFFVILSSLTGLTLPLFVLVPFFAIILFGLGFDKITALTVTVGSILTGSIASTYGFNISGYTKNILAFEDMNTQIVGKIILLVLLTALLILFVLKFSSEKSNKKIMKLEKTKEIKEKKTEKTKKEPTKTAKRTTTKKPTKKKTQNMAITKNVKKVEKVKTTSIIPLVIILVLMMIVTIVGMYNWYYSFNIELFDNMHKAVMGVKIGDFPIFEHLLSGSKQFGYWGNTEFVTILVIVSASTAK